MKCPNCGYQNAEGEVFCDFCSKELKPITPKAETETKRTCVSCSRPIGWNDYACQYCGHVYGKQTPTRPSTQSARERHCVFCGRSIDWNAQICAYCGYDYRKLPQNRR